MSAALEFKQDPKLTTYVVEDGVVGELKMKVREYLAFGIMAFAMAAGSVAIFVSVICLGFSVLNGRDPGDAGYWLLFGIAVSVVALFAAYFGNKYDQDRLHYYTEVPQGKILSNTTRGGGEGRLEFCIVVEGYNRMMQVRTYTRVVNAGKWRDGVYVVGEYFDVNEKDSTD